MSERVTIEGIDIDTSEAEASLKQLEMHSAMTAKSVMKIVRKSYTSMILLADIMGVVIPEWFALMGTAAMMTAQALTDLAAAETVSVVMSWKATATFAMAAVMFQRAMTISMQQTEAESKLNSLVQLMELWS